MTVGATAVHCPSTTTNVLVVDDHQTFSDLLSMALQLEPDFHCVGTAKGVRMARLMVDELRPDLVLMDVRLGDGDGIAATAELTRVYPSLRVVVLTAHIDATLMQGAANAGACGLLPKDGSLLDMLAALRSSRRGAMVMHPALITAMMPPRRSRRGDVLPPLTRREQDVLRLLAAGSDVRCIAVELGISLSTCRGYVKNLLLKLNAHSQLEAVVIATTHGLVATDLSALPGGIDRRQKR